MLSNANHFSPMSEKWKISLVTCAWIFPAEYPRYNTEKYPSYRKPNFPVKFEEAWMNNTSFLVNKELLRKVTCYAPLTSKITKCPPACDDALPPEAIGSEKLVLYTDWVQHMLRNLAGSSCRCCAIKTMITIQANYNRNLWTPRAVLLGPRTKD